LKNPSELRIPLEAGATTTALAYPAGAPAVGGALVLGHGAGAGQRSPFMVDFAHAISALGVDVITFNFLYTEQRRRIPDRGPVLEACYRSVIATVHAEVAGAKHALFIGGKSMGGRIATQVAAESRALPVAGLVLLGYPLHPPGRPTQRRDKHLPAVGRPMLFVQGTRDAFGTPTELAPVLDAIGPSASIHVVSGGDHSLKLARKDPAAQAAVYDEVQRTIVEWMRALTGK
jgi:predicted alpha/beta-hydrolase family hydrolase